MPPNPPKDAIVIVLDVGKSVSSLQYSDDKTFFELARDCVSWIIQRKIIAQSLDVLSLLIIGSDESENVIAINGYKNICGKFDFQVASWDMLKFIETEIKTTKNESDWLGALVVSLEMLKVYEEFNNVQNKKIVFFSDFIHPAPDDINIIIKSVRALNVEITIIGPDHFYLWNDCDDDDEPECKRKKLEKTLERREGEKLVSELWKKLPENVVLCTFESALKQLCSYTPKVKRINYWNCIMDIGDVKINISVVKKTDPKTARQFSSKCVKPGDQEPSEGTSSQKDITGKTETAPTVRDKVMHYKHEAGEGKEFVDIEVRPEDTVEGFRYGTTIIPFSEEDKTVLKYKSGPKCFSVIGFTNIASVPYYLLSGECTYLVLPRDKDKNAEVALSALIQAMKKMQLLGIVRRVYSDDCGLSLGILHPIVEEIVCDETSDVSYREYLLFVELAFEEDVKSIDFPSLEEVAKGITEKQYDAVDNLINGMNLMKADKGLRGEPCEAFDLSFLHDFKEQFFNYCVIQRGLYPEKPLPSSLPVYMKNFLRAPKSIEEKCKTFIKDIKDQFKIELTKEESHSNNNNNKDQVQQKKSVDVIPAERQSSTSTNKHFREVVIQEEKNRFRRDWMTLFSQDFPTDDEFEQFLSNLKKDLDGNKASIIKTFHEVIIKLRAIYLKVIPDEFNSWVVRFKSFTKDKKGVESELWEILVTENLGLISVKENRHSKVSQEEAEEFLCEDKQDSCYSSGHDNSILLTVAESKFLQELEKEQMDMDSFF